MRHSDSHGIYRADLHLPWAFRKEAYVWAENKPVLINFYPAAFEMSEWMSKRGFLSIFSEEQRKLPESISNPYSYHLSTISIILGEIINQLHDFGTSTEEADPKETEIGRIRLHNEMVLYFARFYEACIKQLLFVTSFSTRRYKNAALGALLAFDCKACRKSGTPHGVSLLGSLAHKYRICHEIDACSIPTIQRFNQQRNVQAAHASADIINTRTSTASRTQLKNDSYEQGTSFLHSLTHIAQIELAMQDDLCSRAKFVST